MDVEVEAMRPCRAADANDGVPAASNPGLRLTWEFSVDGAPAGDWSWSDDASPPLDRLTPIRQPHSSEHHRHVPATVYSMTNGDFVSLESGLEHDLVRRLDRDPAVVRILPQPFRLRWSGSVEGTHTPDILSLHSDGAPTVWDVRAPDQQDDDFLAESAVLRQACPLVRWRYELFAGMGEIERLNMLWLNGFRRKPPWAFRCEDLVLLAVGPGGSTMAGVFSHDDGSGELISTMWHLLWCNKLQIDTAAPWTLNTIVTLGQECADD